MPLELQAIYAPCHLRNRSSPAFARIRVALPGRLAPLLVSGILSLVQDVGDLDFLFGRPVRDHLVSCGMTTQPCRDVFPLAADVGRACQRGQGRVEELLINGPLPRAPGRRRVAQDIRQFVPRID